MQRLFICLVALIFISCSQTFIEETQEVERIDTEVSYNTMSEGILLSWKNQPDYARIEVLRGETPGTLVVFNNKLVQEQWLDTDNIPGRIYYYQVKAYNSRDRQIGQSVIVKGYRSYRPVKDIESPRDPIASQAEYPDKIEIFWVGDPVDRFRVYRVCSSAGRVKLKLLSEMGFSNLEEMIYIDKDVLAGTEYVYRIASVGQDENGAVIEKFTENFTGSTLDAPSGLSASKKDERTIGRINLAWTEDASVSFYKVYRSDTEDGTYEMIAPYVSGNSYTDTGMPVLEGTVKDGQYTYPFYYYKIKSVKKGVESEYSTVAAGQTIDPDDYLAAPSLELTLDKSEYPYVIDLEWAVQPNTAYQFLKIDENGTTNIIEEETTVGTKQLPNELFDTQWQYVVRAINHEAGGLLGEPAVKYYKSVTPAPPILNWATKGARTYVTNYISDDPGWKKTDTWVYWWVLNWFRWVLRGTMTGSATDEWVITSIVDYIDLEWEPLNAEETIAHYNVYRRRKYSGDDFVKVREVSGTKLRDVLAGDQLLRGSTRNGVFSYPVYEYQITASYGGGESIPSGILEGSAIYSKDILPVTDFLNIPFHYANGTGFGSKSTPTGPSSLPSFSRISDRVISFQRTFLAWEKVVGADDYLVRHSRGVPIVEDGIDYTSWYTHGYIGNRDILELDAQNDGAHKTGMYCILEAGLGYVPHSGAFTVAPKNSNAGYIIGDERGIIFREPSSMPAYYYGSLGR